jgi:hypothetical protein
VVRYDGDLDELQRRFVENGIFGGIKVADDQLMLAVTEKRTKEEMDHLLECIMPSASCIQGLASKVDNEIDRKR